MTVKLVTDIQRWIGLDSDTKPITGKAGSTFYELNTGQGWIWDGTNWVEDIRLTYAFSLAL